MHVRQFPLKHRRVSGFLRGGSPTSAGGSKSSGGGSKSSGGGGAAAPGGGSREGILSVLLSSDGSLLRAGGTKTALLTWDAKSGERLGVMYQGKLETKGKDGLGVDDVDDDADDGDEGAAAQAVEPPYLFEPPRAKTPRRWRRRRRRRLSSSARRRRGRRGLGVGSVGEPHRRASFDAMVLRGPFAGDDSV